MTIRNWTALLAVLAAAVALDPARAQTPGGQQASADSAVAEPALAYELSAVDVLPELLNREDASRLMQHLYPREQKRRHETAAVIVRMIVRPDGTADSTHLSVENEPQPGFDDVAVRVARAMRFKPARLNGEAVPVWVTLPIVFNLPPRSAPPAWTPGSRH